MAAQAQLVACRALLSAHEAPLDKRGGDDPSFPQVSPRSTP